MARAKSSISVEQKVADAINKAVKKEVAAVLAKGGFASEVTEVIPSGIGVLDHFLIGCGGWPVGRCSEVFGIEGAGKSALALHSLASVQKMGGLGILAETEQASSMERAKLYGVDPDKLILLEPAHIEETLDQIEAALHALPASGGPTLIVWDSIAATPTKAEIEEGVTGKVALGERARLLSKAIRTLAGKVTKKRAHLMLVNQVRENIGGYGYTFETPGGHAVKFFSSVRVQLMNGPQVKAGGEIVIGRDVKVTIIKNKVGIPHRKATMRLWFVEGWREGWTTLNHAKDMGVAPEGAQGEEAEKEARIALGWTWDPPIADLSPKKGKRDPEPPAEDKVEAKETPA